MDEITIGEKTYISSKRAAEITGYAKDYIGQLSREGYVDSKKIGRSWYVYEPSIRAHRFGDEEGTGEDEVGAQAQSIENSLEHALEDEQEAVAETESALGTFKSQLDTWKQPVYTPEEPQTIPQTAPKVENAAFKPAYEELLPPAEETLTDMQAAWKEWFEQKQEELETPEIESPEVMEAREREYEREHEEEADEEAREEIGEDEENEEEGEVSVPLHRMDTDEDEDVEEEDDTVAKEADIVPIRPIKAPIAAPRPTAHIAPNVASYAPERPLPQAPEARIVEERVIRRAPAAQARTPGAKRATRTARRSNAPVAALLVGVSLVVVAIAYIGSGFADPYLETLGVDNSFLDYLVGTRVVNK